MPTLFDPFRSSALTTPNRMVMAPMTRMRSTRDGLATPAAATYYAQRASAGLIITEGVQPSLLGQSNAMTPGLFSDAQVESWQPVTAAVHANGGRIFAQIMHGGRIGHVEVAGEHPVGPSAVAANATLHTASGARPAPVPRALSTAEVGAQVRAYAAASERAIRAGFDGVELHGANGYLIQQFLAGNSNLRDDRYGGSIANRIRFAVEAVESTAAAIGADRVALRLSPGSNIWDVVETDVPAMYDALLSALSPMGMAYLHLTTTGGDAIVRELRSSWDGALVVNPSAASGDGSAPGKADGQRWLDQGADLVSFGRAFLANPDLVERFRADLPLQEADPATFYQGGDAGYVSYPHFRHGERAA